MFTSLMQITVTLFSFNTHVTFTKIRTQTMSNYNLMVLQNFVFKKKKKNCKTNSILYRNINETFLIWKETPTEGDFLKSVRINRKYEQYKLTVRSRPLIRGATIETTNNNMTELDR